MDVIEAIKTRRSIRQYQPNPVSDNDLAIVLEAARWAPSWANTQCTRFVVVRDNQTKAKLAEVLASGNPATSAMIQAPIVMVACAELKRSGYYKEGQAMTDKGDWFMFDVALAMQNITLAALSLGMGTVHVGLFDAARVARILNVPEGFAVVEMMPLGYPAVEGKTPRRKELTETVFYESWGQPQS